MDLSKIENRVAMVLVIYLFVFGIGSAFLIVMIFPSPGENGLIFPPIGPILQSLSPLGKPLTTEQMLILLAFLAGSAGSFIHSAQSLISYIGNKSFKLPWTSWYLLRPWIGGVLGFGVYFALRAGLIGLVSGQSKVDPYGLVAICFLAGWFSKTTADKLQEVFETLFKSDADEKREDPLKDILKPEISEISPASPIPSAEQAIKILGKNFTDGATVTADGADLGAVEFVSSTELKVTIGQRPAAGAPVEIKVKNPSGKEPLSDEFGVEFE